MFESPPVHQILKDLTNFANSKILPDLPFGTFAASSWWFGSVNPASRAEATTAFRIFT